VKGFVSLLETYNIVPGAERELYGKQASGIRDPAKKRQLKIDQFKKEKELKARIQVRKYIPSIAMILTLRRPSGKRYHSNPSLMTFPPTLTLSPPSFHQSLKSRMTGKSLPKRMRSFGRLFSSSSACFTRRPRDKSKC
jgi:hypothetical protein